MFDFEETCILNCWLVDTKGAHQAERSCAFERSDERATRFATVRVRFPDLHLVMPEEETSRVWVGRSHESQRRMKQFELVLASIRQIAPSIGIGWGKVAVDVSLVNQRALIALETVGLQYTIGAGQFAEQLSLVSIMGSLTRMSSSR